MDEPQWQAQVRKLNGNFHGQELRPETAAVWYDEGPLEPIPVFLISLAIQRIIRTADYPPRSVAGLLRVVEDVRGEMAHEQAEDATRTCPGCCTEDVPGWVEVHDGPLPSYHPCGDCRPGRYEAFQQTRKGGWPDSKTGRNVMASRFDKATGFPKGRGEA
jgi:hypothetical protein